MKAQRAYWDAWTSLSRMNPKLSSNTATNPWSQALDHWWKAVGGGLSGDSNAFFSRMIEQGKTFFNMGQQMVEFLRTVSESTYTGEKWREALQERFDAMKTSLSMAHNSEWSDRLKGLMAFYELPLDTWRRTLSGATALPGDFLQNLRSGVWESIGDKVHEGVDRFLSVPGVGYTRESQEQMQNFARLVLDYQKALQDYADTHGKLGVDTIDRLYKKIVALTEKGEKITALRQVYDLWVDSSEEAYGEFVMSPTFQEIYGRMVNALMRVKHHAGTLVDETLGALNMPTRREMNTVLKRQQELRRELRALQVGRNGGGPPRPGRRSDEESREIAELRTEVAALREEVTVLRNAPAFATVSDKPEPVAAESEVDKPKGQAALRAVKRESTVKPARAAKATTRNPSSAKPTRIRAQNAAAAWDIQNIVPIDERSPEEPKRRGAGGSKR